MNCDMARRMIDAEDGKVGIDGNPLRTHLEECASCGKKFAEVLFLMREGGRHAEAQERRSHKLSRVAVATAVAAIIVVVTLRSESLSSPMVDRRSNDSQAAVAAPSMTELSGPVVASERSVALSIEETATLRFGRFRRSIDATTIGGIVRPAEIGPRHIPLPRTK